MRKDKNFYRGAGRKPSQRTGTMPFNDFARLVAARNPDAVIAHCARSAWARHSFSLRVH